MKSQPSGRPVSASALYPAAAGRHLPQSAQTDLVHQANDGVIRLYGPGGPDTALKRAAAAFQQETGILVEVTAGPEHSWRDRAVKDADLIFAGAEQPCPPTCEATLLDSLERSRFTTRAAASSRQKGNPARITGWRI